MKDGASASSLAIAEKRPPQQKPGGGCIGVFFQLFNWKKKLFFKKLLPPVSGAAKRVSKKITGREEKMQKVSMAKLLLIADENNGGFPNTKRSEDDTSCSSSPGGLGDGMRAPGLVARLMGLESMPVARREKTRNASGSKLDGALDQASELEEICSEMGGRGKAETRPQKVQKTGVASRFSSNSFQFNRSMLASSRRQHHKLASPVKSPRMFSRRNKTRLMEAATKILEPGLQYRNQGRCALTYISSSRVSRQGSNAALFPRSSGETSNDLLVGSCKNCGNVVEVTGLMTSTKEAQVTQNGYSDSDFSNASSSHGGSEEHKPKPPVMLSGPNRTASLLAQSKVNVQNSAESGRSRATSLALQAKINVQSRVHELMEKKCRKTYDRNLCMAGEEVASGSALKHNNLRQNQLPSVHEKAFMGSEVCGRQQSRRDPYASNGTKDFVALNRNPNNCTRPRSPSKVLERNRVEMERNDVEKKNIAQKRRLVGNSQIGNEGMANVTLMKQRSSRRDLINETATGVMANRSINKNNTKIESWKQVRVGSKRGSTGMVSFTSPMSQCSGSSTHRNMIGKNRSAKELVRDASISRKLVSDAETGNFSSQKGMTQGEDALTALLKQIGESLVQDAGDAVPRKSPASGLEELISALSDGSRLPKRNSDGLPSGLGPKDNLCCDCTHLSNYANSHVDDDLFFIPHHRNLVLSRQRQKQGYPWHIQPVMGIILAQYQFLMLLSQMTAAILGVAAAAQAEAKAGISMAYPASDGDHPSPISILDASFSNDSCYSWSRSGCSGCKPESTVSSCRRMQALDPESDVLDSASSTNIGRFDTENTACSVGNSSTMHSIYSCELKLKDSKLRYYIDAISNAALLFESSSSFGSNVADYSSIDLFLHDMVEAMINASHIRTKCSSGFTENKERSSLWRLHFDCMIECLDSKYCCLCSSCYKAWSILPLLLSKDRLVKEVEKEITGWTDLAGKTSDELIERDMNLSTGTWTQFKVEAFEICMQIEDNVLQVLIDETVIDFCWC
ncbi:putative Epididymal secretory protein E1 [Cocos nucifera]|uniref:Putative Epididymal secretory protein E1 n=1 Tax=Cocos nucifera TaxID=13894 RepID=A0A8K0N2Z8_COCNU|nr:putative Epididymal secretory protein E1 [Cocos nucifera]